MLIFYDNNHNKIAGLTNYREYNVEREFNSEDTLSFQYPSNDVYQDLIQEECYIRTRKNEYIVKEVNYNDDDWVDYVCKINIENIKGQNVDHFEVKTESCIDAVRLALAGTGWTVGSCDVSKIRPVSKSTCTAYDVLQEIQSSYDCEMSFDSINKKVYIYNQMGEDKGAYFAEQLNLKKLEVQGNSYDYVTKLVPIGKDGLDITAVNNGINYIENHQYSNKSLIGYWEDNRYTDPTALMEDAIIQLNYLSRPLKSYKVDLVDLAKAIDSENYAVYNLIDYSLGDTVTILSREKNIKEKQRIAKMTIYPEEPERNEIELSNKSPSLEYLQIKFQDTSDVVDAVTTSDGTIDGSKVDNIDWDNIQHVHIEIADVDSLNATIANIGKLNATEGDITILNAVNGNINNLLSSKANIDDLSATNANIENLVTSTAKINTLLAGNIKSDNMATDAIQAGNAVIAKGAIASAQIIDLDVSKLNAGNISTNKFVVQSDSGNLQIKENNLKVWDTTGKERVSLGLNGSDYNLLIRGSDGSTVLFGTEGVTHEGITQGSVDNSNIAEDANINGGKIEKESLIATINGATTTLKASRVKLDTQAQTLDLAFTSLSDTVTSTLNTVSSQGTTISTIQGNITNKIWNTDITTAVNNIQVGGRNLCENSNFYSGLNGWGWFSCTASTVIDTTFGTILKIISTGNGAYNYTPKSKTVIGQTYTWSAWIKSDTASSISMTSEQTTKGTVPCALSTNWKLFSGTGVVTGTGGAITFYGSSGTTFYVANIKYEIGNKATDWTPAPEDMQSQITIINNNYSTMTQTLGSLASSIGSLNSKTDTTNGNVTSVNNQLSTLSQTVNGLTATVTSVQQNYLKSADASTTYATSSKVSVLQQSLTGLSSTVSSVQTTVATKANSADVNTAINNIQVGVTNYILNGHANLGTASWSADGTGNDPIRGNVFIKNDSSKSENYLQCTPVRVLPNTTYTVQAVIGIDSNVTNIDFYVLGSKVNNNGYDYNHGDFAPNATPTVYTRYTGTFTTGSDENYVWIRIDNNGSKVSGTTAQLWATAIKLEQGTKATDWTPSIEDTQSQISGITFTNLVNCTVNNNAVTDTSGLNGNWCSGCSSVESFNNGQYVEATITGNSFQTMLGLSHTDKDAGYVNIQYAWYVDINNNLRVFENNTTPTPIWKWSVGNIIRIAIENNVVNYYQNGLLRYSSTQVPVLPLVLDVALANNNTSISNITKGTMLSGLSTRISTAESYITQLNNRIDLRVTTDTYNSGIASANITAKGYANTAQINAISSAKSYSDSQISVLSGQISSKVDVNGVISTIKQNASAVQIAFNSINSAGVKIDTSGLSVESGYFKITRGGVTAFSVEDDGGGNVGLELGTATVRNMPYLDFHSSGYANDNDARIICSGGTNNNSDGNSGAGHLAFYALGGVTFNTPIMANGHRLVETESTGLECITYLAVIGNTHIACNTSSYNWGIAIYGSDRSLKRNIANTDIVALDKIMLIQHRQFDWIEDITKPHTSIGYISQELMDIDPQFAFEVPQGLTDEGVQKPSLYQPDESIILPTITKAIQELQFEISDLKLQITKLQNQAF